MAHSPGNFGTRRAAARSVSFRAVSNRCGRGSLRRHSPLQNSIPVLAGMNTARQVGQCCMAMALMKSAISSLDHSGSAPWPLADCCHAEASRTADVPLAANHGCGEVVLASCKASWAPASRHEALCSSAHHFVNETPDRCTAVWGVAARRRSRGRIGRRLSPTLRRGRRRSTPSETCCPCKEPGPGQSVRFPGGMGAIHRRACVSLPPGSRRAQSVDRRF
jgi:hypothetical protein